MAQPSTPKTYIVIVSWNGKHHLKTCLDSVQNQSEAAQTIIVDNASHDGSVAYIRKHYPWVHIIQNKQNEGFAGGVNPGIAYAIKEGASYIALLNNDAVIHKDWLKHLRVRLEKNKDLGAVTCKLLSADKQHIDSTGDFYSSWGLSVARQRDHNASEAVDHFEYVFGACAGASLYRAEMFADVGLLDEAFFAYFEDTDLNFRMQSKGWKAGYEPKAEAYHATGSTSSTVRGLTTYLTLKNLPMLFWKNVPTKLIPHMLPRFTITYWSIFASAITRGKGFYALKGVFFALVNLPHAFKERRIIRINRVVSDEYLASLIMYDLPELALKLRKVRAFWWKIRGRTV